MDRTEQRREYMRQRRLDPEFRAREAQRMRELRKDPAYREKERPWKRANEKRRRAKNPKKVLERNNASRRIRMRSPEYRARIRARFNERYRTDEAFRTRWNERQNARHHAHPERHPLNRCRLEIVAAYGAACVCCGETERLFLEIDHVDGGGRKHIKSMGTLKVYKQILAEGCPPSYRLLCSNCNHGRYRNGGVCPHESARLAEG